MTTPLEPVSVRILADDLTGACDAAAAFASVGMSTVVVPSWDLRRVFHNAQVVAFNTESRDILADMSTGRMNDAAAMLNADAAHHIFKKVDSVFRGNTFAEIAAVLSAIPHQLAVLAPAFPELGRTINRGILHKRDFTGEHTLSALASLRAAGIDVKSCSNAGDIKAGKGLLLCDSETQDDLLAIVRRTLCMGLEGRVLWIGSGGLAHAMAAILGPARAEVCAMSVGDTVLFVVGSEHPVTLKQLEHLRLSASHAVVVPVTRGVAPEPLREQIVPYLSRGVSCVFATGGDTALAVCRAMQVDSLVMQCEFARGLPQSRIVGGPLDGTTFLLKSGGFGDESILSRIAHTFAPLAMSPRP